MRGFRNVGGIVAIIQAVFFFLLLVDFGAILPGQGLPPDALGDPTKVLPQINSTGFLIGEIATVVFAVSIILVVLAVYERLEARAPALLRLAVIAATVSSVLFLANGMIAFGGSDLANVYAQDKASAQAAYHAFFVIRNGLLNGAIFAASLSALSWSVAAMRNGGLSTALSYVVLLGAIAGLVSLVVPPVVILLFVVNTIWSAWLGIELMREPTPAVAMA